MDYIDGHREEEKADPELAEQAEERRVEIQAQARDRIQELADSRRNARKQVIEDNDDEDDDEHDMEVVYAE
jgi:GTP-binding protein